MTHPIVLGIIPARGGSKGIVGKNIVDVAGRPLIDWTVKAALDSGAIDRVVVSTDDNDIAKEALAVGAEVPFMRPVEIAGNTAASIDVVRHCLEALFEKDGYRPDYVMLLQPTSPLRTATDILNVCQIAVERDAQSVVSVVPVGHHPDTYFTLTSSGNMVPSGKGVGGDKTTRRQDFNQVYAPNGAIYLTKTSVIDGGGDWYSANALGYIMEEERSIDIDTQWDLKLVRLIIESQTRNNSRETF